MIQSYMVLKKISKNVNKKIPSTNDLLKKTDNDTKIRETENKVPSITGSVNTAVFNTKVTNI